MKCEDIGDEVLSNLDTSVIAYIGPIYVYTCEHLIRDETVYLFFSVALHELSLNYRFKQNVMCN